MYVLSQKANRSVQRVGGLIKSVRTTLHFFVTIISEKERKSQIIVEEENKASSTL